MEEEEDKDGDDGENALEDGVAEPTPRLQQ